MLGALTGGTRRMARSFGSAGLGGLGRLGSPGDAPLGVRLLKLAARFQQAARQVHGEPRVDGSRIGE